ncbi:MAG: sigma-70 family RNA polymerase sigma factor [Actinobacteria bacterium]|nr:sigma-70 family RNA polymerase sigma factor [Actinomycetota bacterium]
MAAEALGASERIRARTLLRECRETGRRLSHDDEILLARLALDGRWVEQHWSVDEDRISDGREAARLLELDCLGLVALVARRYRNRGVDLEDLVQEGWFGVRRAVELWDYRRGFRLSTYAAWWVRHAMERAVSHQGRTIRLPRSLVRRVSDVVTTVPLDFAFTEVTASVAVGDHLEQEELAAAVNHALAGLGHREREVVQRRFGFHTDLLETLECIGCDVGVTRERVRQIESSALQKLRQDRGLRALHSL